MLDGNLDMTVIFSSWECLAEWESLTAELKIGTPSIITFSRTVTWTFFSMLWIFSKAF